MGPALTTPGAVLVRDLRSTPTLGSLHRLSGSRGRNTGGRSRCSPGARVGVAEGEAVSQGP